jgi:AraC-like DNA-binding protein
VRLIKARHLLRHTDESVTDIAYRCGFGDSNHFSTLFRREFNWSPRDIRQGATHSSVTRGQSTFCRKNANNVRLFAVEVVVWPLS